MRIIPVLDLRGGQVVRAVGGQRAQYRPVCSVLAPSSSPLEIGRAFRDLFGLNELYVADLDAIGGAEPDWGTLSQLRSLGFELLVDAGLQETRRAQSLIDAGVHRVVAGLESLPTPDFLGQLIGQFGPDRVVFSLDLKSGQPLGYLGAWRASTALAIALQAVAIGVRHMIVLDLARVGTGRGLGTEPLCRQLREREGADTSLELIVGGGIQGADDLQRLAGQGVDAVLVASALHDGRISRRDVDEICCPSNRCKGAQMRVK